MEVVILTESELREAVTINREAVAVLALKKAAALGLGQTIIMR